MKFRHKISIGLIVSVLLVSLIAGVLVDKSETRVWTAEDLKNISPNHRFSTTYFANDVNYTIHYYNLSCAEGINFSECVYDGMILWCNYTRVCLE